ncbi:uncharacterized protein LOC114537535 [Dendronephthya gigantea]|uniref:uncharacterized protein LOC114537535 n=1 Tax=Dendronephthya gigantea TaxID=151771 RepID=UPI001069102B|nr:uncharacterized protein LOC114537535 [Dendronephthya gigantea]
MFELYIRAFFWWIFSPIYSLLSQINLFKGRPSSPSYNLDVNDKVKRWVVVGICLNVVLLPALRDILDTELQKWYNVLCSRINIDKQVYSSHKKNLPPSKIELKYENINYNNMIPKTRRNTYDYKVKSNLCLAKLFVQPFMAKFTGFDETMDLSVVLTVLCEASPFASSAADAKNVRSDIRNEWAHSNFSKWTPPMFNDAFQGMKNLVINTAKLSPDTKKDLCDRLEIWRGLDLSFEKSDDETNRKTLEKLLAKLQTLLETLRSEDDKQMKTILKHLEHVQSSFQTKIEELESRLEKCEKLTAENSERIENLEQSKDKQEEEIPYVFKAPQKNRYFCGRDKKLEDLERILKTDDPEQENVFKIAAVCGLGGIGKTSLVTEYAYKMKEFYSGGVYWFSAENDTFFQKSVNEIALKIGSSSTDNFDSTLTKTIIRIGKTIKPCLIVLDCLDELSLSSNILKFLSLVSRDCPTAALVLISRRNKSVLVEDIHLNLREDHCLSLKCFEEKEGKEFLSRRTGLTLDEHTEPDATSLVDKLGGLPLALEQAGACIKAIGCSISDYLEKYNTEHLKLLGRRKAKPLSENESPERLAVNTTWLLNLNHIKQQPGGVNATLLMNAYAFLNPDEIEQELVNIGQPPIEHQKFADNMKKKFDRRQAVTLLTDFSLFMYVHAQSISTHRLVQELVRENLTPEDEAKSFSHSVRLLSFAFFKCKRVKSPRALLGRTDIAQQEFPESHSEYHLWSKLCHHGFHLFQNMEILLENLDLKYLQSLFVFEAAEIFHECAVYLSVNSKHIEAKRTLNLAYRIIDWIPSEEYKIVKKRLSSESLSVSVIPVPKRLQMVIRNSCAPPLSARLAIEGGIADDSKSHDLKQCIEKLRKEGNEYFKEGHYVKALEAYTDAIDRSRNTNFFDPLLLTNRASAFIKLNKPDDALRNSNEYISLCPLSWQGYSRKALSLVRKDDKDGAEIAAALAHYYNLLENDTCIFDKYEPFKQTFKGLKERIRICDSVSQFELAIRSNSSQDCHVIIVLGSKEYSLNRENQLITPLSANQTEPSLPVKNCTIIGAQLPKGKVTFKIDGSKVPVFCDKCILVNLLFSLARGQIICHTGSSVKILDCNFTSCDDKFAAVVSRGETIFQRCKFTNCQAGGLICEGPEGSEESDGTKGRVLVVVDDCTFSHNMCTGIEVRNQGILTVRNSRMYNNKTVGLVIGPKTEKCEAFNCQFYNNSSDGIIVTGEAKGVTNCQADSLIREGAENFEGTDGAEKGLAKWVVDSCTFSDNMGAGIVVENHGILIVRNSRIYNNKLVGLVIGPKAAKCETFNCHIYNNFSEGVLVTGESKDVTIMRNQISENDANGIVVKNSEVELIENKINDNEAWGIWSQDNFRCNILMNNVFRNKFGGVRDANGIDRDSSTEVVLNTFYDNFGPGFFHSDGPHSAENRFKSSENREYNNQERLMKQNYSSFRCSQCFQISELKQCEECLTTAYCGEKCEEEDRFKHKRLCKVLRTKSSLLLITASSEKRGWNFVYL